MPPTKAQKPPSNGTVRFILNDALREVGDVDPNMTGLN